MPSPVVEIELKKDGSYRVGSTVRSREGLEMWMRENGLSRYIKQSRLEWLYTNDSGEVEMAVWENGTLYVI